MEKYYAVFDPNGDPVISSIGYAFEGARANFASPIQWERRQEEGYSVHEIIITKTKDNGKANDGFDAVDSE